METVSELTQDEHFDPACFPLFPSFLSSQDFTLELSILLPIHLKSQSSHEWANPTCPKCS